jgi:two-component system sensor histidine kinase KdpD
VGPVPLGVLALIPRSGRGLTADQRSFLEAFTGQAAFAFERARLSEQARALDLRAKTEELRSTLLSTVSHDLRTPLASITGTATTLRGAGQELSEDVRHELLDTMCEEAERMERLVTNLLDMTRLESGGLAPKCEWVPLEELVGAALTRLEHKLRKRPVQITLAPDLPLLSVDPVLMQQVFLNLIENATKYTPDTAAIEISARRTDVIEIDFADRGPGIPSGDEERIFERFYRGTHHQVAGVGLGLPICRGIIEAHGGHVSASNRSDGGACFRIQLPIVAGAPSTDLEGAG